ncbi:MAG TPA: hypothetical protein VK534_01725 [Methylomirabilota bacterium]|nr:hypothetical protein [Methylomirabilota bacterium]
MSETKQTAAKNVLERIEYYRGESKGNALLAIAHGAVASFVAPATVAVFAENNNDAAPAVILATFTAYNVGSTILRGFQANADSQRAAALEGALAQHELATDTIVFDAVEQTDQQSAPAE